MKIPLTELRYRFRSRWDGMNSRCRNGRNTYKGVTVCKRWKLFENFEKDLWPLFVKHYRKYGTRNTTLERMNGKKGYEPSNCRWATYEEQANNTKSNDLISFNGKVLSLAQWAKKIGITQSGLWRRIYISKWPIKKALTTLNQKTRLKKCSIKKCEKKYKCKGLCTMHYQRMRSKQKLV